MIDVKDFRDENNAILALGRTLQHIRAEDLKRILDALEAADELAGACELDDVVYTFVQRYRDARGK